MKKLIVFLTVLAVVSCGPKVLEKDHWQKAVHETLSELILECGNSSADYAGSPRPYAVFDFDNTSVVGDISNNLMVWQIEHLQFGPQAIAEGFLPCVEDRSVTLPGYDITAEEMSELLMKNYTVLKARLDSGTPLDEVQKSEEYLTFRAAFFTLYEGLSAIDYAMMCQWMPALLSGLPMDQARSWLAASTQANLKLGECTREEWVSPDGRFKVESERGLVITDEMRHLYQSLTDNGIDVYVCSASMEWFVETLACDKEIGFGLPEENVFGLRFVDSDVFTPEWVSDYSQPLKEGKVACIESMIAPLYGGAGPVLVGGDSNGDVAMLTSFDDMRHGLIWDRGNSGDIAALADQARAGRNRGRYLVD